MAEFFLNTMIFSNPIITWLFFIIAYAILGGGIKYIDDAFDERTFRLRNAILLAPILGIFWAYAMTLSDASAAILGAILIAVFLKGKIDNIAHQLGIVSIFLVLLIFGLINFYVIWLWLIVLVVAGLLDEIGNDYIDRHLDVRKPIRLFFEFRFVMKLVVFYFAVIGVFAWFYFFAFLAFDIAYASVMEYSMRIARNKKFSYHKNHNGLLEKVLFNGKG